MATGIEKVMIVDLNQSSTFYEHARLVEEVLRRAVREAVLAHKRAGNPIAVEREGKVVWIQPEDIQVDEP